MRKGSTMTITLILVSTMVLINGCAPKPSVQPPAQQPTAQQPQTTQPQIKTPPVTTTTPTIPTQVSGKDLYDKNCAGCHGANGTGGTAPKLNTAEWNNSQKVAAIVKAGAKGMPAYQNTLKEEEIKAISDYVALLAK